MKVTMKILSSFLVVMPFLVTLSLVLYFHRNVRVYSDAAKTLDTGYNTDGCTKYNGLVQQIAISQKKNQSGLVAPGANEKSCTSRFESSLYRKTPPHKPSPYLLSKLRSYEERHRRCGPNTESYNNAVQQLKSGGHNVSSNDCNYVVYISSSGLGNRILTITASFLYALLTDRVLLVDSGNDVSELFCEPFPGTSWSLPDDFPLEDQMGKVDKRFPQSFGNMLRSHNISTASVNNESIPSYLYMHLNHDYTPLDKLFFCDDYHSLIQKVPWLLFKSNNYFVPSFFLMSSFDQELSRLFPEKETVFHHLGRYLFNPSNNVWGMVKRYHQAYLAKSDEIIGIQVRTFDKDPSPFEYVMDQIIACTTKERLLPQLVHNGSSSSQQMTSPKSKVVLITSLSSSYFDKFKELYWLHQTKNGDIVGIHQPSHEELQQTQKQSHNTKAWAEMYLLSLSDVLVTSGWSTFGYVAQGLGGLRPWILPRAVNRTVPDLACLRV